MHPLTECKLRIFMLTIDVWNRETARLRSVLNIDSIVRLWTELQWWRLKTAVRGLDVRFEATFKFTLSAVFCHAVYQSFRAAALFQCRHVISFDLLVTFVVSCCWVGVRHAAHLFCYCIDNSAWWSIEAATNTPKPKVSHLDWPSCFSSKWLGHCERDKASCVSGTGSWLPLCCFYSRS